MFVIFFLILVVEIVLVFSYSKLADSVASYSRLNGVPIFGRIYKSVYELYFDQNFLNGLFAGESFESFTDVQLKSKLILLRRLLFAQLIGGAALFLSGIGMGLMNN